MGRHTQHTPSANPLATEPKREKSGSDTSRKYSYQYHWAFCRMLDEHQKGNSYALFVEEHEDVTLSDSLDPTLAKFEFNQVKEQAKKLTVTSLISKRKGKSILVKMAEGACNRTYSDKIKVVNLVSTGGFKFKLHDDGFSYEVITSDRLRQDEIDQLRAHLIEEFGSDDLLSCLEFVVPDLPAKGFDVATKGKIAELINVLSPGAHCSPQIIYACVIEDLRKKGENSFDYAAWNDALKKKAVTSEQLQEIINQNVTRKDDTKLQGELLEILKEDFQQTSIERRNAIKAFQRYYDRRVGERSLLLNNISAELRGLIESELPGCKDTKELVERVGEQLSSATKAYFNTPEELQAAVLYEYITAE